MTEANIISNNISLNSQNQPEGLLLVDKPKWLTSHGVVSWARKYFNIKKIGHAGALDPFATGLLIILVGKATKLSETFLTKDKTYKATVALGIKTNSGDVEGEISRIEKIRDHSDKKIQDTLSSFKPSYNQFVPVFSSVKVNGEKLRVLARKFDSFKIIDKDLEKFIHFFKDSLVQKEVKLPSKKVNIYDITLLKSLDIPVNTHKDLEKHLEFENNELYIHKKFAEIIQKKIQVAEIEVSVSKGTYIRQLAMDIGERLNSPAVLLDLRRTKIGEFTL